MSAFPVRPTDTTPEAERVQLDLLRAAPVGRRLHLAWSLTAAAITAARRAIARANPGADAIELDTQFVAVHYGKDLAEAVRAELAACFERLAVRFFLTGSVASSAYGIAG